MAAVGNRSDSLVGQQQQQALPKTFSFRAGPLNQVPEQAQQAHDDPTGNKVAISRMVKQNCGPMRGPVNVPARPKPGRKPMADNTNAPEDKRKRQNREAQRQFRDRRAQKVHNLECELAATNAKHEAVMREYEDKMQKKEQEALFWKEEARKSNARAEAAEARAKAAETELARRVIDASAMGQQQQSAGSQQNHYTPYPAAGPTPPAENENDHEEFETDFTSLYARKQTYTSVQHQHPHPHPHPHHQQDIAMTDTPSSFGVDDHCGFCSNPDNCLCRDAAAAAAASSMDRSETLAPISQDRAHPPPPVLQLHHNTTPSYLEAPTRASGPVKTLPGTCDMCLADPEKARQCRELAQASHFGTQAPQSTSAVATPRSALDNASNNATASINEPGISCSDFIARAKAQNIRLGGDLLGSLHVHPYTHRSASQGIHDPAMEIDAQDAAHALAQLSRQTMPGSS